jgi:cutinase
MTVIYARGTGEAGNCGTVAGPPMFAALRSKMGADGVTIQGVDYAASEGVSLPDSDITYDNQTNSRQGNANQAADGGKAMAALVATALAQCPDTKIVIAGYSQGAMAVHSCFNDGVTAAQVAGAINFGDPLKRENVGDLSKDKISQFCGKSDQICGAGGDGGAEGDHTSYGAQAEAAADFAISVAGCNA